MEQAIKKIQSVWFLFVPLVLLIIWYANTNSRISAVEAKQTSFETSQQQYFDKMDQLITDMAVVKTDVGYIKKEIDK